MSSNRRSIYRKQHIICHTTVLPPQELKLERKMNLKGSPSKDRILHTLHVLQNYKTSPESVDAFEEAPM